MTVQRTNPASESGRKKGKGIKAFLVGAAGFEPTTCSTQNCRATRLRYTPINWETTSIHASWATSKEAGWPSPTVEERMSDAVAGFNAVFFGRPRHHLQHPLRQSLRRNDPGR